MRRVQTTRTKGTPLMWEMSSAMQTQVQKKAYSKRMAVQIPAQTQANSLNSNNRLCNASLPMIRDTAADYLLSEMTNNEPITIELNN